MELSFNERIISLSMLSGVLILNQGGNAEKFVPDLNFLRLGTFLFLIEDGR
ncbi:hypothetical protein MU545_14440 [Enterococcus faecium]|nr:hypothetical protein [Enterococcus faecium]